MSLTYISNLYVNFWREETMYSSFVHSKIFYYNKECYLN